MLKFPILKKMVRKPASKTKVEDQVEVGSPKTPVTPEFIDDDAATSPTFASVEQEDTKVWSSSFTWNMQTTPSEFAAISNVWEEEKKHSGQLDVITKKDEILDNKDELKEYAKSVKAPFKLGIRVAAEEEPTFPFYTSRLGIRAKDILEFYVDRIEGYESKFQLKMLHIFLNKGIKDDVYYWSELNKIINLYCQLKKICPELDSINIGGGFPIKHSLGFNYDYQFMIDEIVRNIKVACKKAKVPMPNIFTEFGSFTVGESMAHIYSVIGEKIQNDRETWYMIDSSFITTLPDTWGIGERFLLLPINKWDSEYQRVVLGGITCDSHDYYDSEEHINEVFLPKTNNDEPLYLGFFHTGAYQDQISGYGGIKHCLIPSPKHIIVGYDKNGKLVDWVYAKEQTAQSMLKILGYVK